MSSKSCRAVSEPRPEIVDETRKDPSKEKKVPIPTLGNLASKESGDDV